MKLCIEGTPVPEADSRKIRRSLRLESRNRTPGCGRCWTSGKLSEHAACRQRLYVSAG